VAVARDPRGEKVVDDAGGCRRARDEEQVAAVEDREAGIGNEPLHDAALIVGTIGSSSPAMISVGWRRSQSHGKLVHPNVAAS
jgi:hypothetical protein